MKLITLLLIAFGCSAISICQAKFIDGELVETFIAKVLEKMKIAMREGTDNLWVMDPVTTRPGEAKSFGNMTVPFAKIKELTIDDVDIRGLSHFKIDNLNVDIKNDKGHLELVIDTLEGTAGYKVNAVAAGFIPIRGQGPADLKVKDTRFIIDVDFKVVNGDILHIDELELDMKFGKVDLHLDGLNGAAAGTPLARYFDKLLSYLSPLLWGEFKNLLITNIVGDFRDFMNNKFRKCPLDHLESVGCHKLFDS